MTTFLLEVGTEELPASFLSDAIAQWKLRIPESLETHGLEREKVEIYGTPRRLAVLITGLPLQQPDREEEIKGPSATAGFKNGQPTPAAIGFAKKQGVELAALEIRPTDKGEFIFVRKQIPGRLVAEIFTQLVPQWIWGLEGKRFMRWGEGDAKFSRPIRSLIVMLDGEVIPLELENGGKIVKSDRISQGHRVLNPEAVTIEEAANYVGALENASVIVDQKERKRRIINDVENSARDLGGYTSTFLYPELLEEVINLVEFPSVIVGKFEPEFLQLPTEVIIEVMVTHQRYFPIFKW